MLPIRGNALGLVMLVATGLIAGVGSLVLQLADGVVMMSVGGALVVMDLLIRLRVRPAPGWLTQSYAGGHLFFLPVWGAGLVILGINLLNSLGFRP